MDESTWLATTFEEHRPRLTTLASRMLGSKTEADDAVQEAWIRFSRSDTSDVENLGAWLTTVVSRVCLNALQSRRTRSSDPLDADLADPALDETESDPEREALLADSVGLALLIVLDSLTPTERVAFVLHDMFAVPFEDIAPIVGRNAAATRQLASRARRRVQHTDARARTGPAPTVQARRRLPGRGAARRLLRPRGAARPRRSCCAADAAAVAIGAPEQVRGAEAVAAFSMRGRGALAALVDGVPAAAWMPRGQLRVALLFTFSDDRIATIEAVAEPERLATLDLVVAGDAWT